MKLFEIRAELERLLEEVDEQVAACVDPETGEVIGDIEAVYGGIADQVAALEMDRETARENLCCAVVNLRSDAKAIREQEQILFQRRKAIEKKADRLAEIVKADLDGQKWSSPRVAVTWRTSTATEVDDTFLPWAEEHGVQLLRYKAPEPDKTAIGKLLKQGQTLPGCKLVQHQSMTIK